MFAKNPFLGGQNIIVSSAYWRWVILDPPLQISIPSQSHKEVAFLIRRLSVSAITSKRKGDKGSPCLIPRCSFTRCEDVPIMSILADTDITRPLIHSRHFNGKFICWSFHSKNLHETLSKAFWKSNLRILASILYLLHDSMIHPRSVLHPRFVALWWRTIGEGQLDDSLLAAAFVPRV